MIDSNTSNNIQLSKQALDICRETLEQVSTTCCDSNRSPRLNKVFEIIENTSKELENFPQEIEQFQSRMLEFGQIGALVGELYVSCCTDTREPLYQKILKHLNMAHGNIMNAMGITH